MRLRLPGSRFQFLAKFRCLNGPFLPVRVAMDLRETPASKQCQLYSLSGFQTNLGSYNKIEGRLMATFNPVGLRCLEFASQLLLLEWSEYW